MTELLPADKPWNVWSTNHCRVASQKTYRALKQKELELKDKEKELKHEQAHRRAMEILIELANEHYNIDIRKNSGTKQWKGFMTISRK